MALPRGLKASTTPRSKRATVKQRKEERERKPLGNKTPDGQVISSEVKRRESVKESIATQDIDLDDRGSQDLHLAEVEAGANAEQPMQQLAQDSEDHNGRDSQEEVAKELALAEREWNDRRGGDELTIPVIPQGQWPHLQIVRRNVR